MSVLITIRFTYEVTLANFMNKEEKRIMYDATVQFCERESFFLLTLDLAIVIGTSSFAIICQPANVPRNQGP